MIEIQELEPLPKARFEVTVHGKKKTIHEVRVTDDVYQRLTDGAVSVQALVKMAFAYLLEQEENTQIMSEFDLEEIEHYFPKYEEAIRDQISDR